MKFLFTTNPLLGHFLPMVPLIRAARAAGHQVRVATGADLAPAVHRHGFPIWVVGPTVARSGPSWPRAADPTQPRSSARGTRATVLFAQPGVARARQLVPMAAAWRPDVVVHELAEFAGWEAAAVSGAIDVVHGFGTHVPDLPELAQLVCTVVAEELGTPNRAREMFTAPYLDPCPPSLQPPGGRPVPRRARHPPRGRGGLPGRAAAGGDAPAAVQADDLPDPGHRVQRPGRLVARPRGGPRPARSTSSPRPGPTSTRRSSVRSRRHIAMAQFVPQALVMRHVDAVVCHAGSGTMLGALAEGRPMVALPMGADQFANAEQIVRTGAGLAVRPEERTPETIRAAIEQVLGSLGFAQAAYALQAEIAAMPSAEQRLAELVDRAAVHAA